MGRVFIVVVDMMYRRSAAADVVRDVFNVRGTADARWRVHARDFEADAMPCLEHVGRGHDLNIVLSDLARNNRLLSFTCKRMPRPSRLGPGFVYGPMRGFKPAPGEFSFREVVGDVRFTGPSRPD